MKIFRHNPYLRCAMATVGVCAIVFLTAQGFAQLGYWFDLEVGATLAIAMLCLTAGCLLRLFILDQLQPLPLSRSQEPDAERILRDFFRLRHAFIAGAMQGDHPALAAFCENMMARQEWVRYYGFVASWCPKGSAFSLDAEAQLYRRHDPQSPWLAVLEAEFLHQKPTAA